MLMAIQSWGVGSVYTWHRVRLVGWMNWWMMGGGIISSLIVWLIESCCTNKRGFIPCIHVSLRYWGRNQNVYAPKATTNNTHTHVSKPTFLPTQKVDIIISTVWVCNGELLFGQISMQQYISSVINPFLFKSTFRWSKGLFICTCFEWGKGRRGGCDILIIINLNWNVLNSLFDNFVTSCLLDWCVMVMMWWYVLFFIWFMYLIFF